MALQQEIENRAKQIHTDGYSLSIGELMSLYKDCMKSEHVGQNSYQS